MAGTPIRTSRVALVACFALVPGAASGADGVPAGDLDDEKIVRIYNWEDYIDPDVLDQFARETGIAVDYEVLDSNDLLETKLKAGRTGYDVVFPSGTYLRREILDGYLRPLDKRSLANLGNADPKIARKLRMFDPDNEHAVTYLFGTTGIAYNVDAVAAAVPDAPVDSLAMIWDPAVVSKFAGCGVAVLDSPSEVVGSALTYLGKSPNSEKPEDLAAAEKVMLAVRPYIREISSDYVGKLVSGEICVGLDWSGDALQAMGRVFEERRPYVISYRVPREGSFVFLDTMAIPADASHVKNAHLFIDYMLRGDVAAKNSEFTNHANGNQASLAFIDSQVRSDENFFPSPEIQDKLVVDLPESQEFERQLRRTWTRFTGAKY